MKRRTHTEPEELEERIFEEEKTLIQGTLRVCAQRLPACMGQSGFVDKDHAW